LNLSRNAEAALGIPALANIVMLSLKRSGWSSLTQASIRGQLVGV